MGAEPASTFAFLYRTDAGRIGRGTWWRGVLPLAGLAAVLTGLWTLVRPYTSHDLATSPFLAGSTILAFVYLALFSFALILIAVCVYNLSAKRFRDRGRPAALAAVLPLCVFGTGALVWFIPQSFGAVPDWAAPAGYGLLAAVLAWNLWDLGVGDTHPP